MLAPCGLLPSGFTYEDGIVRRCIPAPTKNGAHRARRPPPSRGQALRVDRPRPPLRRGPFAGSASVRFRAWTSILQRLLPNVLSTNLELRCNPSPTLPCFAREGEAKRELESAWMRCLYGAPAQRRAGAVNPKSLPPRRRGAMCRMHIVFRQCMDALSKNSVAARGPGAQSLPPRRRGMCGRRGAGVHFFLVPSFLLRASPAFAGAGSALRPSGRLRRSRRSIGAVGKQER